jgi:GntR family transcriptional regulator
LGYTGRVVRLRVDPDRPLSPSRQIVEAVLDAVASGGLARGDRLPSVRDAAEQALVNPNTVARAWRELELAGVVAGRAGTGVFVTDAGPEVARRARREATLAGLRRALDESLRSGHAPDAVREETEKAVRRARVEGARAATPKGGR